MNQPKPLIPREVPNKVPPAIPVKIIKEIDTVFFTESFWEKVKSFIASKVLDQIIKNADKIIIAINKYEDYLYKYISNKTICTLLDAATDILEKLIVEWKKEKELKDAGQNRS